MEWWVYGVDCGVVGRVAVYMYVYMCVCISIRVVYLPICDLNLFCNSFQFIHPLKML